MKLITLNIEGDRHLNRVIPFLQKENPDVFCIQEAFEDTASKLALLGYTHFFLPMTLKESIETDRKWGVALFVRNTTSAIFSSHYYHTLPGGLRQFDGSHQEDTVQRGVAFAQFTDKGIEYRIGTTHFTWTENGECASPAQIAHMDALIAAMTREHSHILCGDFNIPRKWNPLYENLLTMYTDDIPDEITSSLDPTFHHLGSDPSKKAIFDSFMVDYIFSQTPYVVSDVRLEFGISDHAAVIGNVRLR